ncbi:unnamed protein product [Sphagnum troendelagicum]|uniref:Uncharacterized protein n=1 Tax=Sphagnum troendelagicum TaxID=128251 RepID=A0ABP0TWF8_9BRYO
MNAAGRCEATLLLLWGCSKHVPSLVQAGGVRPHCATFVGMLIASAIIGAIEEAMCTHEQFIQSSCK